MAQEFKINSSDIENKINQLLPSQGGFGAGVDFSASTMVIPIVDLTESAEGSAQRQDLQSAIYFNGANTFDVSNTTSTIVNTTGYWRIIGTATIQRNASGSENAGIILNDGTSIKYVWQSTIVANTGTDVQYYNLDFIVFLAAGHSLQMTTTNVECFLQGSVRQIADISGNLISAS